MIADLMRDEMTQAILTVLLYVMIVLYFPVLYYAARVVLKREDHKT